MLIYYQFLKTFKTPRLIIYATNLILFFSHEEPTVVIITAIVVFKDIASIIETHTVIYHHLVQFHARFVLQLELLRLAHTLYYRVLAESLRRVVQG